MLLLLSSLALAGAPAPCATPELWAPIDPTPMPFPPPPDGRGERDAYGAPNVELSEHFALRWGNGVFIPEATRQTLLDAFERSWAEEIEAWDHTAPYGTDAWYFNVYIGDTGDGAPPGYGAGGYYTVDREGWPMIVVAANTTTSPTYVLTTVAHEFYHAVQGATSRYDYDVNGPSAWFWEATATWASSEVYPENPDYASFLFGYAFYPHKRVNFFDYPDSGVTQEYYQYGAFIFPYHLAEFAGGPKVIRDAWEDSGNGNDPLEVLRQGLAEDGLDLDVVWMDHVARSVTWDYPNQYDLVQALAYGAGLPESSNQVAGKLPYNGSEGEWIAGPSNLQPERYGYNVLSLGRPQAGEYLFELDGDVLGSAGSSARFAATVVRERTGHPPEYLPLAFEGTLGTVSFEEEGSTSRLHLAIGAWTTELGPQWRSETFPYRYRLTVVPAPDPASELEPEPTGGCGCDGAGGLSSWWLGAAGLVLLVRRRRSRTVPQVG